MLKDKFKNYNYLILMVVLTIFSVANFSLAEEIDSVGIKNSISAEASTGGNKSEGENLIETGDASVSVNAKNVINGEESNVESEIEARVNDEKVSIKVINPGKIEIISNEDGKVCREEASNNCSTSMKEEPYLYDNYFEEEFESDDELVSGFLKNIFDLFHEMIQSFKF